MNNYHLYEEIGHGRHSTVYKSRKKHTIDFVAVKMVPKFMQDKVRACRRRTSKHLTNLQVQNEVNLLHRFDHPNVLRFINWYTTRRHLWIILEYCTGGDLLSVLRQDGYLPEPAVKVQLRSNSLLKSIMLLRCLELILWQPCSTFMLTG